MQSPGEWIFGLVLVVIIGLTVAAIARQIFGKPNNDYDNATRRLNRPSIRRAVMRLAEVLAVLQVILLTVGGAVGGGLYAGLMAGMTNQNIQAAQTTGALLGGAGGFISAMVLTGLLFTLAAIEENTRTTATMLAIVARPRAPTA